MRDDPEAIASREKHQKWTRDVGAATEAMDEFETLLPTNWFGRLTLRWFGYLRRAWAKKEEELRSAARETYEDRT